MHKLADRADWRNLPLFAWGASRTTTPRHSLSWPARRIQNRTGATDSLAAVIADAIYGGGAE